MTSPASLPCAERDGWAAWHPKHGLRFVRFDMDDACRHVRELNREERSNNRNGWRAVRVRVVKV